MRWSDEYQLVKLIVCGGIVEQFCDASSKFIFFQKVWIMMWRDHMMRGRAGVVRGVRVVGYQV